MSARFGLALLALGAMAGCTHYNGIAVRDDGSVLITVETTYLFWVSYDVLECQAEARRLDCHELAVHKQVTPNSEELSRPRLRPNLGAGPVVDVTVPYDDGHGVRSVDPATLIGDSVVLRLVGGSERRVKVVDVKDGELVVNYRGSEWTYPLAEVAVLTKLAD